MQKTSIVHTRIVLVAKDFKMSGCCRWYHEDTQYHFYDSLLVAAAIESRAFLLYTENLQHERHIGPIRIINPFL